MQENDQHTISDSGNVCEIELCHTETQLLNLTFFLDGKQPRSLRNIRYIQQFIFLLTPISAEADAISHLR
jgi:hypothetical protein